MNSPQNTFFPTLSTMKPRNGEAQAEIMNTTLEKKRISLEGNWLNINVATKKVLGNLQEIKKTIRGNSGFPAPRKCYAVTLKGQNNIIVLL